MQSGPGYAYGINQLPIERMVEAVIKLNTQLAQAMRETGTTFTLDDPDQRFQALLQQLEDDGICHQATPHSPILIKDQRLQAQWVTISKLARARSCRHSTVRCAKFITVIKAAPDTYLWLGAIMDSSYVLAGFVAYKTKDITPLHYNVSL